MTKTCTKCHLTKDLTQFSKQKTGKFGVVSVCKDCQKLYRDVYYAQGTPANEARKIYLKSYRQSIKEKVFAHYGSKCNCCGESTEIFLTLDHKNNDGAAHRRALAPENARNTSTDKVWRWVVTNNFPDTFQILCYNCNCGKRDNGGVCPHKEAKD